MQEGVFTDGATPSRSINRPLLPPGGGDTRPRIPECDGKPSDEFAPLPQATTPDGKLVANQVLWDTVRQAWDKADDNMAQLLADAWADVMGWSAMSAQVSANAVASTTAASATPVYPIPMFTPLTTEQPKAVLEQFDTYFLGVPWLCTGVVPVTQTVD